MSGESSYKLYVIAVGRCTTRYNPDGFVVDPFGPRHFSLGARAIATKRTLLAKPRERGKKRVRSTAVFGAGGEQDLTKRPGAPIAVLGPIFSLCSPLSLFFQRDRIPARCFIESLRKYEFDEHSIGTRERVCEFWRKKTRSRWKNGCVYACVSAVYPTESRQRTIASR
jgi:hypothetical protein